MNDIIGKKCFDIITDHDLFLFKELGIYSYELHIEIYKVNKNITAPVIKGIKKDRLLYCNKEKDNNKEGEGDRGIIYKINLLLLTALLIFLQINTLMLNIRLNRISNSIRTKFLGVININLQSSFNARSYNQNFFGEDCCN